VSPRNKPQRLVRWAAGLLALGLTVLAGCAGSSRVDGDAGEARVMRDQLDVRANGDGYALSFLRSGTPGGRRIVFVHGTPGSATAWRHYLRQPPAGLDMIAVDRPGFGQTRPRRALVSLMGQAEALLPLMRPGAQGQRPILVGHSLGGPIIAKAALLAGEQIGGLIVLAGSFDPALEKIHPAQYLGNAWPIRWLIGASLRHSNLELLALKPELELLAGELMHLSLPITIVHGTKDRLVPYANVGFLQTAVRGNGAVDLVRLEGEDHFIVWSKPETVRRAIAEMVDQLEKAGR